ncbi:MAG TPA: glycosyltransferase family 39 protein [Spirochaetota bacterium]|nr:glycosyltransferase family 39 protein [Spirochaetota bacterium]HPR49935.1 glycosyltransferase family 39 protein [Spirochaetota bacterium]
MLLNPSCQQLIQKLDELIAAYKIKQCIFPCLCVLILVSGCYFRLDGYFCPSPGFSVDEAQIARYLSRENGLQQTIEHFGSSRPIGYLVLSKIIVEVYNVEETLRLTSLLPSLITLLFVFLISRTLFRSRPVIIMALLLFSFNPFLISFAKEFKHYSLEVFSHVTVMFFFLRYCDKKNLRRLIAFLAIAYCSVYFSLTVLFLFPGLFIYIFIQFIKDRDYKGIGVIVFVSTLIITTSGLFYLFFWESSMERFVSTWQKKYMGFNSSENSLYIQWVIYQFGDIFKHFFKYPSSGITVIYIISFFFISCGVFSSIYTSRNFSTKPFMFIFPLLTVVILNYLKLWPLGVDRTNLFLIVYFNFLFLAGFELLFIRQKKMPELIGTVVMAVLFFLFIPPCPNYYHKKNYKYDTSFHDIKTPLEDLYRYYNRKEKVDLFLNPHARIGTEYYLNYHQTLSVKYKDRFARCFRIKVYKTREENYVKKHTRQILEQTSGDVLFLLYHFWFESKPFYDALNANAYYTQRVYNNALLVHAVNKKNGIKKIPVLMPEKEYDAEDGVLFAVAHTVNADVTAASGKKVTDTRLYFNVLIQSPGEYELVVKLQSPNRRKKLLRVITGDEDQKRWPLKTSKSWEWIHSPFKLNLQKGKHVVGIDIPPDIYCDKLFFSKAD